MSSESARVYVIEHVDPAGPREGLHDQREPGVVESPSYKRRKQNCCRLCWGVRNKSREGCLENPGLHSAEC